MLEEIDTCAFELSHYEQNFVINMIENRPALTSGRKQWIEDLYAKYVDF